MNSATAAGFLGGDVTAKFVSSSKGGQCEFSRTFASGHLLIEVVRMESISGEFGTFLHKCGVKAEPVKAIGNEAFACSLPMASRGPSERLVGRVRQMAFVVTLSIADSALTQTALRQKTIDAAEIVAGNLF